MVHRKLDNYLRTVRKHAGLSQCEVGFLLGCKSGQPISRYEHGTRVPELETLLAYRIIFGVSVEELIPGRYQKVERLIAARARKLSVALHRVPETPRLKHKLNRVQCIGNEPVTEVADAKAT